MKLDFELMKKKNYINNCYFSSLENRFKNNENILNLEYFQKVLSSIDDLFNSYEHETYDGFTKRLAITFIARISYDDVLKIIDNIILNNYNVCYSVLRSIIEQLLIIKLLRHCKPEALGTYHYLKYWRKSNKNKTILENLKKEYGENFDNGAYSWAISEIIKLETYEKDKIINLNDIKNCLVKIYNDSEANKLYTMFDKLSKSSHAISYEKSEILFSEDSDYNNNHKKKICNDTTYIINLIINEINALKK